MIEPCCVVNCVVQAPESPYYERSLLDAARDGQLVLVKKLLKQGIIRVQDVTDEVRGVATS
jgi:hypothetical protein